MWSLIEKFSKKEGDDMSAVYLDHAATSPIHPKVMQTMAEVEKQCFGNPSSIHRFGREARQQLELARGKIAESIGAKESEIIFTSGGTEADNLAIVGTALRHKEEGRHIVTSSIEHHAVLHSCKFLESMGFEISYVPVGENGVIQVDDVKAELRDDTVLVSIMFGNNEVGTIQPIAEIGALLNDTSILFHSDAVQAYGMIQMNVQELGVDLLSTSAHKINGPKGIGFLYVKEGVQLTPLLYGGKQEQQGRAGTENVAGIVGFQTAVDMIQQTMETRWDEYVRYRKKMLDLFDEHEISFRVNGDRENMLPHILNVSFPNTTAEALLVSLDLAGVAVSSGSACTAGSLEPSHVLGAMYSNKERGKSAIRFSFGLGTTMEDIEKAAFETIHAVKRITGR